MIWDSSPDKVYHGDKHGGCNTPCVNLSDHPEIPALLGHGEWHEIKTDGDPKEEGRYIVRYISKGGSHKATFINDYLFDLGWSTVRGTEVTHWMKCPKLPTD